MTSKIIDSLDIMQCRELAWVRLLVGEIAEGIEQAQYRVENGGVEKWELLHMLEHHALKINMACSMLATIDTDLGKAVDFAKEG